MEKNYTYGHSRESQHKYNVFKNYTYISKKSTAREPSGLTLVVDLLQICSYTLFAIPLKFYGNTTGKSVGRFWLS